MVHSENNEINKNEIQINNYLFLDIETTGLDCDLDDIIKIYYVLADKELNIIEQNEYFINTGNTIIPEYVTEITGITQKDVDNGENMNFLFSLLKNIIKKDTLIISYNAKFTLSFIATFLAQNYTLDVFCDMKYLDLLDVFMSNEKGLNRYRIIDAINFYGIDEEKCKQNDLLAYYELFKKMQNKYDLNTFIRYGLDELD